MFPLIKMSFLILSYSESHNKRRSLIVQTQHKIALGVFEKYSYFGLCVFQVQRD